MYNHACKDCTLYRSSRNVCLEADGPHEDVELLVIGEAPGEQEARTGKPFCGKSGQLLRAELAKAGITEYTITNTVKCRPPDNRAPTPEEIKACRKYLDAELEQFKPKYVLTLGATASKAVLKKPKITEAHGQLIETENFVGMPAFHPAYALRDPSKLMPLRRDIERLARTMRGEKAVGDEEIDWKVITSQNLDQFIKEFEEHDTFAFDLETTGLDCRETGAKINCLSIAFDDRAWVLPLGFKGSPFWRQTTQVKLFSILSEMSTGKTTVAHNGKFDNIWLAASYGHYFHLSFDTMLAHHLLDENSPHGLKELVRTILDGPDYDLTVEEKKGNTTAERLYEYAAKDTWYTLKLYRVFSRQFQKNRSLRRIFYKLIMPAARAFQEIDYRGLTVDLPKMKAVEADLREKLAKTLAELNAMTKTEVNWNSPAQVGKLLYGELGLIPTVLTDKGAPSTGEEALYAIKDEHPIAGKLVEFREYSKFLSTYIEGWREFMHGDKLYLSTKLHGTVTGRYASRLHQVPRDGSIRNLIVAPSDGWTFVQADFSQAELRVVAHLSQDPELMYCFRHGIDVHWRTLLNSIEAGGSGEYYEVALATASILSKRKITHLPDACAILAKAGHNAAIAAEKRWKEGRKKAKGINFGYVFGMRERKFIEYAKLKYGFEPTMEEATAIRDAYFHLYARLSGWHDRQRKLVRLDGEVKNLIGRVRRLPGAHSTDRGLASEAERQSINSPVQGFIGDLKAMAVVEIEEEIPAYYVRIVGEVHDSILMEARTEHLDEYLPKVASIMRHPKLLDEFGVEFTVPIEVDLECGPWGAGKAWK